MGAPEVTWDPEDDAKPVHKLLIKSAILMPSAKKDDINIVEIESEGYNQEKVKVPILAMRAGTDLQTYVDILVPNNAKITLVKGEGPVHLVGSHCIDFFASMDGEADDEDDEMEVKGKGDDVPASPIKTKSSPIEKQDSKKRKASEDEKVVEKKAKASPAK